MLHKFGGKNCWCFKDWFEINFTINGNVKQKDITIPNTKNLPCLCFEGANASGKTSALKVLSFIFHFGLSSFNYKKNDDIPYRTFFGNQEESEFFMEFSLDDRLDDLYYYELVIDTKKVIMEKLSVKKGKCAKKSLLFSRKFNRILKCSISDIPKDVIYKENASFFSTLFQYGVKSMECFEDFFKNFTSNVSFGGVFSGVPFDFNKYYYDNPDKLENVILKLQKFDTGIQNIVIKEENNEDKKVYKAIFYHDTEDGLKNLPFDCQSEGTKVLYQRLLDIALVLERGGIFCFDEIDTKLHNDLVPILLRMFLDPKENPNKAQLIFTSYNPFLMDIVRKYGTYIFEKEKGECFCYRCDEINPTVLRNDRNNLSRQYVDHFLGGYPKIE